MKTVICLCLFQLFVGFIYSQSSDTSGGNEINKVLDQQLFPGTKQDETSIKFSNNFEEINVEMQDGFKLNGLLFKAKRSKGLIFYLHGSNGALDTWSKIAPTYLNLNYDIFILDYRGYGKSESKVASEKQLYSDVQAVYNNLKIRYPESKIVLIGQSIGSGAAAMLAANNNPKKLVLQAPYYSLADWIHSIAPKVDTANLKYQLKTYEFLQKTQAPVIIFHGDEDKAIYYGSSQKLSTFFKPGDKTYRLERGRTY